MREFLLKRPPRSAIVVELEVNLESGGATDRSAELLVRFSGQQGQLTELVLARTHPHPRQLFTNREAIDRFASAFRRA